MYSLIGYILQIISPSYNWKSKSALFNCSSVKTVDWPLTTALKSVRVSVILNTAYSSEDSRTPVSDLSRMDLLNLGNPMSWFCCLWKTVTRCLAFNKPSHFYLTLSVTNPWAVYLPYLQIWITEIAECTGHCEQLEEEPIHGD